MIQKTVKIQQMDVSKQNKDSAIRIMGESLDMVIEQTSLRKINQIVMQEFRKKRRDSL